MEESALKKSELLAEIDRNWNALTEWLAGLSDEQMTAFADAQGWTIKDHLIHISRWERWAIFYLRNEPCHLGVGVPESLYRNGPFDAINAVIFQQTRGVPLNEAMSQLHETHRQLLDLLHHQSEAELQKPYREPAEEEGSEASAPPAANVLAEGTAYHYAAHLGWMKALLEESE